jgi:PAS domain S-box-containing protein
MISILYVDDEVDLLDLGRIFLEEFGDIKVDTAPSAQAAVELLRTRLYDAVVSDFQMPDMDGIEFLQYIRSHAGGLPVILFTGKGKEEVVIAALNYGADYYLQKGGEPEAQFAELRLKIKLAVDRQKAEDRILFFNRLYSVMSGINTAILHIRSRDALFDEICRICVEEGKFSRVWIGLQNPEKTHVLPVASRGFPGTGFPPVPVSRDEGVDAQGLSGHAAFVKKPVVQNGIGMSVTSHGPNAAPDDYHSSAAFPVWHRNAVIGTFQIYAREPVFFGDDETRLLVEVVSDISFALENLEAEEQRIKAERALQESEEKFRILVEESLVGVYIIQGNRFIHVNPKFAEILGYPGPEIVENLAVDDLVMPDDRDLVKTSLQRRLSGEVKSLHYSFRGKRQDGTIIDLEVAGTRAVLQGQPIIIGTIIDVTERRKAEAERAQKLEELSIANKKIRAAEERLWAHIAALTESQERLNDSERRTTDIINFLPDPTFAIDSEGRVLVWNRAIETMTGIPAGDMVGRDKYEYALPFYQERRPVLADLVLRYDGDMATNYDYVQRDGDKITAQVFLPHMKGGTYAWFTAAPLYDTQGRVAGAIETVRDITEFEAVRRALQVSEERYRTIIDNVHEGVIIVRNGTIAYANPATLKILKGYTGDEIQGKPVSEYIHAADRDMMHTRDTERLSGMVQNDTARFRMIARDGTIVCLESRVVLIQWDGGPALLRFLHEIPESRLAEPVPLTVS